MGKNCECWKNLGTKKTHARAFDSGGSLLLRGERILKKEKRDTYRISSRYSSMPLSYYC